MPFLHSNQRTVVPVQPSIPAKVLRGPGLMSALTRLSEIHSHHSEIIGHE